MQKNRDFGLLIGRCNFAIQLYFVERRVLSLARNEPFANTVTIVVLKIDSSFQRKWLERMAGSR